MTVHQAEWSPQILVMLTVLGQIFLLGLHFSVIKLTLGFSDLIQIYLKQLS